jgi:hypothetical protein
MGGASQFIPRFGSQQESGASGQEQPPACFEKREALEMPFANVQVEPADPLLDLFVPRILA